MMKDFLEKLISRYRSDWHRWYAWHPVFVDTNNEPSCDVFMLGDLVWLNTVERRWDEGSSSWGDLPHWEYRYV